MPAVTPVLLGLTVAGILCAAPWARAKEGAAAAPKKIDHPFLTGLVGPGTGRRRRRAAREEKGAETFRLALMDTVVFDDLDGVSQGGAFQGHGVLKPSDDGKSPLGLVVLQRAARRQGVPRHADRLTVTTSRATTVSACRSTARLGLEMKAFQGDSPTRTVTFTKR